MSLLKLLSLLHPYILNYLQKLSFQQKDYCKPIPVSIETAYKVGQVELLGISAIFNFTEIYESTNTPICFPKKRPRTIPSGTGFKSVAKVNPSKDTPAFANAKTGIIPKAT